MSAYPYADEYPVLRGLPEHGRPRDEILRELKEMAEREDASWENGKVSGSMYCGSHEHYEFLNEAFGYYGHMNALQRDVCPSSTRFEGEVIAMGLDLMHSGEITDTKPGGLVTSGGSGSILHAMLSYREEGVRKGIERPNVVKPETAHPAFDKACHLLGIELRRVAIDPVTTRVDLDAVRGVVTTMIQTEKYGTPLASALRVLSAEFRNERMMRAEEKAARLPAIMTVPLILFILPTLFVVILGPAACSIRDSFINS
jgi:hypothetical protein